MLLSLSYRAVLMPFLPGTQGGNPTALSVVSAFRLVLLVASRLWLLPNFLPMIFFFPICASFAYCVPRYPARKSTCYKICALLTHHLVQVFMGFSPPFNLIFQSRLNWIFSMCFKSEKDMCPAWNSNDYFKS